MKKQPPGAPRYDSVYLHSLREAVVIVLMFSAACVWAVCVSFSSGYSPPAGDGIATVLGMPAWVFYAVLLPWLIIDAAAIWFCFFYMKNDDLGQAVETSSYEFGEDAPPPHDPGTGDPPQPSGQHIEQPGQSDGQPGKEDA